MAQIAKVETDQQATKQQVNIGEKSDKNNTIAVWFEPFPLDARIYYSSIRMSIQLISHSTMHSPFIAFKITCIWQSAKIAKYCL